jgi:membrane-bound lytic murein transglycosylase A
MALYSFRESCPRLLARTDTSGLTVRSDWQNVCAAAATWPVGDALRFFETRFELARVGGDNLCHRLLRAGNFGQPHHLPGFDVPVYGVPRDLIHASWRRAG